MSTSTRPRSTLLLSAALLVTASLHPPPPAAAGPYEIRAEWSDAADRLTPEGVDFAFDAIEHVPRFGVLLYGSHLLLRIEHGEPFVTLGVAPLHDTPAPVRYGSAARLPDGSRLLTRTIVSVENGVAVRRTAVVRLDADGRREKPYAFPAPSKGKAWTIIRLLTDADGQVFAYAGRAPPRMVPINFTEVSPALEQRFYRYTNGDWEELPHLDPRTVSANDACFVDGALFAVGGRIENDAKGKTTLRRGVVAKLEHGHWTALELDSPGGAPAFSMTGIRCGRARDRVYALATQAAPGQSIGHTYLRGPQALVRFDGGSWRRLALPQPAAGETAARVTALTLDRGGTPWVAFAADRASGKTGALYRHDGDTWVRAELPSVPEVAFYSLAGIAFDEDGNGWAIANRDGNSTAPESHGILLAYDGNPRSEWKLRGWRWNPLRQRWLGLLGNLR